MDKEDLNMQQGGMPNERFDHRGEFRKFKTEMLTLMAGILLVGQT